MHEVSSSEVQNHLLQLLDRVEQGEHIAITRHGKPVAHLVPVEEYDRQQIDDAIRKIEHIRRSNPLGDDLTVRQLIDEGRRF